MTAAAPSPNPLAIAGLAFIEYTSTEPDALENALVPLGFMAGAAASDAVRVYRQGDVELRVDTRPGSVGQQHAERFGAGICGIGLRVENAQAAWDYVQAHGGMAIDNAVRAHTGPALRSLGDIAVYLVDEAPAALAPAPYLQGIDHLTCHVAAGAVDAQAALFTQVLGFVARAVPDAAEAGRTPSVVLVSPCGGLHIALVEDTQDASQDDAPDARGGNTVGHLTFASTDLYATVEGLRMRGVTFLDTPQTYYDLVDFRLPGHGEDVDRLARTGILLDGSSNGGLLLQIFTATVLEPLFFEIVQRKGSDGFGQGNLAALFESIELEQQRGGR